MTISAGAGGTEATDWADMLLRMYLRWCERHRFKADVIDSQPGEQAGIKSATVAVTGRFAYGWLRAERGVHRLVRISPYDAQNRRQTTFALVEVMPEADEDVEIELNWDEIRVDTFRSSGAGGQHVQKTESAIRLTHLPTGIVVTCQNERSATQNRELAIRVLKSRLLELELEKREEELRKLRGEHVTAGWGNQIRSYVLHPYQMVKDLRSGHETSNTGAVLDGDLDAVHAGRAGAPRHRPAAERRRRRGRLIDGGHRRRGPGRRDGGRRGPLPAGDRRRPRRLYPASGGPGSRTTSRGSTSRRCPRTSPRCGGCSPTCSPRTRSGSGSRPGGRTRWSGFASASVREGLWFLAMLFVLPGTQARGIGQALMDHAQAGTAVLPGGPAVPGPDDALDSGIHTWGMCTDAVQPISNGLYARRGMVPRIPIWRLFGEVRRWPAVPPLPPSLESVAFESVAATEPDGERRLQAILDELDRAVIGAAHPADHGFLRRDGRVGFLAPRSRRRVAARVRVRLGDRAHGAAARPRPGAPPDARRRSPCARRRPSAPSRCGCPGPRTSRRARCSTPACGWTGSRASSCWSRSPTTRSSATCRSRWPSSDRIEARRRHRC